MPLNYMETGSLLLSKVSVNRLYFFNRLRTVANQSFATVLFSCWVTYYPTSCWARHAPADHPNSPLHPTAVSVKFCKKQHLLDTRTARCRSNALCLLRMEFFLGQTLLQKYDQRGEAYQQSAGGQEQQLHTVHRNSQYIDPGIAKGSHNAGAGKHTQKHG